MPTLLPDSKTSLPHKVRIPSGTVHEDAGDKIRGQIRPVQLVLSEDSSDSNGKAHAQSKRKSPDGVATTNLVVSAHVRTNAEVFPQILQLHVPMGSKVADVTYGKGIFWKQVPKGLYTLLPTDITTGVDCRALPYDDASIDCIVLDPPYMEGLHRREVAHMAGSGSHKAFRETYSNGEASNALPKYHNAVLHLYLEAAKEAFRVLRNGGVFIVKCQDEVSANTQRLTHVELINAYSEIGFYAKDLFVIVRHNRPVASRVIQQVHARKNHSYFLVFSKTYALGGPRRDFSRKISSINGNGSVVKGA